MVEREPCANGAHPGVLAVHGHQLFRDGLGLIECASVAEQGKPLCKHLSVRRSELVPGLGSFEGELLEPEVAKVLRDVAPPLRVGVVVHDRLLDVHERLEEAGAPAVCVRTLRLEVRDDRTRDVCPRTTTAGLSRLVDRALPDGARSGDKLLVGRRRAQRIALRHQRVGKQPAALGRPVQA
jgi:hypothetical protein